MNFQWLSRQTKFERFARDLPRAFSFVSFIGVFYRYVIKRSIKIVAVTIAEVNLNHTKSKHRYPINFHVGSH